jgi:hypothetical protein
MWIAVLSSTIPTRRMARHVAVHGDRGVGRDASEGARDVGAYVDPDMDCGARPCHLARHATSTWMFMVTEAWATLVENGSLVQHPNVICPGSAGQWGPMTGLGPGSCRLEVGLGSFRSIGPGLWHQSGPMPPSRVARGACLLRHGVDVNHRPVGNPKRKV